MTGEEILKCRSCMELFPDDIKKADELYIMLMKKFHPDVSDNPKSNEISAVITSLYRKLKKSPEWKFERFYPENFDLKYIKAYQREDSMMYYCGDSVVYIIEKDAWKNNIFKTEKGYRLEAENYMNDEVRKEYRKSLPDISNIFYLNDGRVFIKINLKDDEIPLDEVLEFYGKNIDSRHSAWIISRIIGLCCCFHHSGNVLDCICTDNFMISPSQHALRLTGGWWFIKENGQKLHGIQSEIYPYLLGADTAKYRTDLECIKAFCRKIFPENSPKAMREYSESICMKDVFSEFEKWDETICKSFGGRYFTEMKICSKDIF